MEGQTTTRILLVDDHEIMRRGMRALLETQPGWEICGEAGDGRAAVQLAGTLAPQVVVMDLTMPELNGMEAARRILKRAPRTQIVILSVYEPEHIVREVLAAGVRGYVLKTAVGADLIAAVHAMLRGETFFTSPVAARIHGREFRRLGGRISTRSKGPLTPRELEILQLLAEGKTNKQVGQVLKISVKTAETHRARIMRKLAVDSLAELVRYAIRNGIIPP